MKYRLRRGRYLISIVPLHIRRRLRRARCAYAAGEQDHPWPTYRCCRLASGTLDAYRGQLLTAFSGRSFFIQIRRQKERLGSFLVSYL